MYSIIVPIFNNVCDDCKSGFKYLDVKYINERQKYFADLEFSGNTSVAKMKLYFNLYIISTKYKDVINLCIKYKILFIYKTATILKSRIRSNIVLKSGNIIS